MELFDHFLATYGYFAIFGLLMLGIVGPFIPDDTILILSGIAVHRGQLQLGATISVAYAGSLCGITLSYALGRTGVIYALERFKPVDRWVNCHLPEVEKWFERYGKWDPVLRLLHSGSQAFHGPRGRNQQGQTEDVRPVRLAWWSRLGGVVYFRSAIFSAPNGSKSSGDSTGEPSS